MEKRWVCLALLCLLPALPALGGTKLDPPDLDRYLRWGPLRVRPRIEITNLGRDDNILSSSFVKVADYTATWSPRVDGLLLLGSSGAFLVFDERLEFTAYRKYDEQNFYNQKGKARLTVPVGGIGFFGDLVLNRVKERPVDLQDIRVERSDDGFGLGVIFEPGWRTDIEIGRSETDYAYVDPELVPANAQTIGERLDRTEKSTTLRVGYQLRDRLQLTLDAEDETIDFVTLLNSQGVAKDAEAWSILAGMEFGQEGALSGSVRAGRAVIDARDPERADFREIIGDAELAYRPNRRTTFRVNGKREPGFSIFEDRAYYLNSRYGARAVYYLNRLLGLEAGRGFGRLTFSQVQGQVGRVDRFRDFDAGVRLRLFRNDLGRRVEYSLRLGRHRRDSNLDQLDLSRKTFGFGAVLGF